MRIDDKFVPIRDIANYFRIPFKEFMNATRDVRSELLIRYYQEVMNKAK